MFPLHLSRTPWSGDCGPVPVRGVDGQRIEDRALQWRGPVDELDAASGVEAVQTDVGELAEGAPGRHDLFVDVAIAYVSAGEVLADDRFDHRGDDTHGDVRPHAPFGSVMDGTQSQEVLHHPEPSFDACKHLVVAHHVGRGRGFGVERRGEHVAPDQELLWDAAMGYRVRNATYRAICEESADEPISEAVASRDLRHLVDVGLLVPRGEKRGRFYLPSKELLEMRQSIIQARDPRDDSDPFEVAARRLAG